MVFACVRNEVPRLRQQVKSFPGMLHVIKVDLRCKNGISSLSSIVSRHAEMIDVFISNAGIMHRNESIDELDWKKIHESMTINAIAPMFVVKSLLKSIKNSNSPKIIFISSLSGAIGRISGFSSLYGYKAGKASLNMMARILAQELKPEKIPVFILHPGTMKTKMGPKNAEMTATAASVKIIHLIDKISMKQTGKFLNFDGTELLW